MNTQDLIETLNDYISSLSKEVNDLLLDKSISQDLKNSKMRPLVDKKKVILETIKSLEIIENKTYVPMCGMTQKSI